MKLKKFIKRTVKEVLLEAIAFDAKEYLRSEIVPAAYQEYEKDDMKRDLEAASEVDKTKETQEEKPGQKDQKPEEKSKKTTSRKRTNLRNIVRRSAKDLPNDTRRAMQQTVDALNK
jgi:hypothetical protein